MNRRSPFAFGLVALLLFICVFLLAVVLVISVPVVMGLVADAMSGGLLSSSFSP